MDRVAELALELSTSGLSREGHSLMIEVFCKWRRASWHHSWVKSPYNKSSCRIYQCMKARHGCQKPRRADSAWIGGSRSWNVGSWDWEKVWDRCSSKDGRGSETTGTRNLRESQDLSIYPNVGLVLGFREDVKALSAPQAVVSLTVLRKNETQAFN